MQRRSERGSTKRVCPYCGNGIDLQDCDIIAHDPDDLDVLEDLGDEGEDVRGRREEVLWSPAPRQAPSGRDWLNRSPARVPLLTDFPPAKNPRRRCPRCATPLPVDLDSRDAHIVSVVGLNVAGKTNFIGAALALATRRSAMVPYAFSEFTPEEETANRFFRDYFSPLFRSNQRLLGTHSDGGVVRKPLVFRVTPPSNRPIIALIHDVAGEDLMKAHVRARVAGFIRRSSALVFILDPTEFDEVRRRIPRSSIIAATDYVDAERDIDQVHLLEHVVRELEYEFNDRPIPLAIVIAKSDLLAQNGAAHVRMLNHPDPQEDPVADLRAVSSEVRAFLEAIGEQRILAIGDAHGATTYHAISALGATPEPDGQLPGTTPVRVVDPLAAVLLRLDAQLSV